MAVEVLTVEKVPEVCASGSRRKPPKVPRGAVGMLPEPDEERESTEVRKRRQYPREQRSDG